MDSKIELLVWTAISLIFGVVVVNSIYRAQGGRLRLMIDESTAGILGREIGLFCFMIGIPFLALIGGASGLDLMALSSDATDPSALAGFSFIHWISGLGLMVAVIAAILIVLWLARRTSPPGQPWSISLLAIRDAFYNEVHWTFYRTAAVLSLGDAYWGTVIGFVLAGMEWIAHPDSGALMKSHEGRQQLVLRVACMVSSSFLYLATQNLWLMILANLILQLAGSRVLTSKSHQLTAEH